MWLRFAAILAIATGIGACVGAAGSDGTNGVDGYNGVNGADGRDAPVDVVVLPGFLAPESFNAGADGTVYIASVATGTLLTMSPDS
ncbi:MAG: hypothetical protein ACO3JL_15645 [Myxococcota bacterium]